MSLKCRPNEIRIVRVYDAPLATVWDAWTDPEQVAQWWGPRGFTLTHHSKDLRTGGHWAYTMHGPDGTDYQNKTLYHEVIPYQRLVYDHGGNDDRDPLFRVTVVFSETNGKTTLDMTSTLPSAEQAEQMKKFIKQAGGNGTWDRLAEYLGKKLHGKDVFVTNRSLDAKPETVFQMWVDPNHLQQWLPPKGFSMEFFRSEIKEGASTFYRMANAQGAEMFGRSIYRQIIPNRQIVTAQQFVDAEENVIRHPFAKHWPETMISTIVFEPEGDGGTRVTLTTECAEGTSPAELEAFLKERPGMHAGWGGSLDALADLLKKRS